MEAYPSELLLIAFVAMLAPLLAELPRNFRLPVVVLEVILGILIGPQVFHLASPDGMIGTLGELGLTFLLFMVGLEIDFDKIRGRPLSLAVGGWFLSFFIAMICMFFFNVIGLIQTPPVLAAVALSTTALGVLAPILRDRGELNTAFGTYMVAAAAVGEFGPSGGHFDVADSHEQHFCTCVVHGDFYHYRLGRGEYRPEYPLITADRHTDAYYAKQRSTSRENLHSASDSIRRARRQIRFEYRDGRICRWHSRWTRH